MHVKEIWEPKPMAASGTLALANSNIGGFLCTSAGTLQVTVGIVSGGADMVAVFDVAEGSYYPLPFKAVTGAYAVLGGGAAGTFAVGK